MSTCLLSTLIATLPVGTSVDFRVRVSDLNNSLNELDVSAYQDCEVEVEPSS